MSHNKGLADLTHKYSIFRLALEGTLIVDDGFFWLLDVHERLCNKLEVFNATLGIENLKIAACVIIAIF